MQARFFAPPLGALLFVSAAAQAQDKMPEDKSKRPSPPATATAVVNGTTVTIDYSRPSLKGRKAFGDKLVPYGEVWRTGANEATTFTVDKPVKIVGKTLPAGKYGLFTIPTATTWTVIFNKVPNQWGAFKYNAADDALRVSVSAKKLAAPVEVFDISVDKAGKVAMKWDTTEVDFTVK